MDPSSQPTLAQLIVLRNEESRVRPNLEKALDAYAEQLPLADPYGVNPRKPHISEVLKIFRAFISEMCEIRRQTSDVNATADYVYKAVMDFCRMTRSGVAIHQLPDDPAFIDGIQVAIQASMFGSGAAIRREPEAKLTDCPPKQVIQPLVAEAPVTNSRVSPEPPEHSEQKIHPAQEPERKIDPSLVKNRHVDLLEKIVAGKNIRIETWARDKKLSRTVLFDWKSAREAGKSLKGKVSDPKSAEIERAIEDDANALGLVTPDPLGLARTSSDSSE